MTTTNFSLYRRAGKCGSPNIINDDIIIGGDIISGIYSLQIIQTLLASGDVDEVRCALPRVHSK